MSKRKKIIVGVIALGLVVVLAAGGILGVRRANAKPVMVVPVTNMNYYWPEYESMEGQITTSATQQVKMEENAIIEQVYVKVGDHVRRGDKLLSFDMTLKQMEYEIALLTRQQQLQELEKAKKRLTSLKNGGPIEEEKESGPDMGGTLSEDMNSGDTPLFDENETIGEPDDMNLTDEPGSIAHTNDEGTESTAIAVGLQTGNQWLPFLAGTAGPLLLSFEVEPGDGIDKEPTETPMPTQTPDPAEPGIVFYETLTSLEEAYSGTGTKADPYRFLCSSKNGEVLVKGSFFNEMAGYDAKGEKLIQEGGYWYRLEFHLEDRLDEKGASLTGYYTKNGGVLENPVDPEEETAFSMADAKLPSHDFDPEQVVTPTPTPDELPPDDDDSWDDWEDHWDDGDGDGTGMTREEAIRRQERTISELELQIKASDIKISRLARGLEKQTIVSAVNGTVTKMGDLETGSYDGSAFMEIQSDGGYYVKGSLSELMLDTLKVGDTISCMSYESGSSFQAEITEVSEFPGESNGYYGSGNTNSSYYPFLAAVEGDVELNNREGVNITLEGISGESADAIELTQAFVRSENGQYYVYKDDGGVLKKQIVNAKFSTDGYSVRILSGLTKDDKIAFPYGKDVKEGAKTKEGTMDELYGY